MKKVLFTIARYEDERQAFFEKYTRPKNKRYCQKNGFEYIEYNDDGHKHRDSLTRSWDKFGKVRELMEDGHLKPGDIVTNVDADMCLVDENCPLVTNKTFSYAIDSCNTHCMGAYSLNINDW